MTTLSIQIKGADLKRQGLENLAREIPIIGAARIYAVMQRAQARLKEAGKPIRYPVNWDSEKQRKAFFATKGFGRGIPTHRTGNYQRGWVIRRNPSASRSTEGYSLINRVSYARYVTGSAYEAGQSNIHRGRWVQVRVVLEQETGKLKQEISEHIGMVARREKL